MSYKPNEATLTSYLYGELSANEHEKVTAYLEAHPDEKKELEEIQAMQKFMGKLQDKEVTEPTFVVGDSSTVIVPNEGGYSNFFKSTIAIAASISLLILVGYFTQLKISNEGNGFQLTFGLQESTEVPDRANNEENIKNWMQETLASNNESLLEKIADVEKDFGSQAAQLRMANSGNKNKIDQDLLNSYVSQITLENRDILLGLLEESDRTQKEFLESMMTDFANYIEEQRQNDLEVIQGSFNSLVNNSGIDQIDDYRNSE